jgi:hypothetical protein
MKLPVLILLPLVACGGTLAQFESEVAAGDAIVAPLVGDACTVIGEIDPSKGATLTCDILDATGAKLGQITSLQSPAVVAQVMAKHAKSKAVAK